MYKFKYLVVGFMMLIGSVIAMGSLASAAKAKCDTKAAKVRCPRANLYGINFSGRNLTGANFTNANLERAVFRNANLTGADFTGAKLGDAVFAGATLDKAKLRGISYYGDPWKSVKSMRGTLVDGLEFLDLGSVDFSGATLTNVAFTGNFSGSKFVNARFEGQQVAFQPVYRDTSSWKFVPRDSIGNLNGTDFTGAIFNAKILMYTAVKGSVGLSVSDLLKNASWMNFSGMDLTGVDFTVARPEAGIDLVDVNISNTNLNGRWLGGGQGSFGGTSTISGASLKGARIGDKPDWSTVAGSPSTLEGATFDPLSSLAGVKWDRVNLSGANVRWVQSLRNASIRNSNLNGVAFQFRLNTTEMAGADFTGSTNTSSMVWPRVDGLYTCPSGAPSNKTTGC